MVVMKKTAKKSVTGKKAPVTRKKTTAQQDAAATQEKTTAGQDATATQGKTTAGQDATATQGKTAAARKKAPVARKKQTVKKTVAKKKISKKVVMKKTTAGKKVTDKKVVAKSPPRKKILPYEGKSGEDYMNAAQVEHFRKILIDWKQTLMEEVERTVHHMQDEASHFPDPNDRATQEEEFALELRTRDRERKLIKKINESLITLETGDYGYCEVCGIEIGVKRLEARPTATLCIDCKTLDEMKERQRG